MNEKLNQLVALLNTRIAELELADHPAELYEPIRYIMSLGGKRARPLLALLAFKLYRENPESILGPALSIEVFHNFTLMHDDIMDQAPLRRGKDTVHQKWDANVAILSGDVMLVKVYEMLLQVNPAKAGEVIRLFNQSAIAVCEGQQLDMNFEKREVVSEEEYLQMIRKKTASLIGYSAELGALLAGAPVEDQRLLKEFAINIGMSFQLKDDLLDVYGDAQKFGKRVGGDIVANKKTYLMIKAQTLAGGELKEILREALTADIEPREKVKVVIDVYDRLNIRKLTENKIDQFFEKGRAALQELDVPGHKKEDLREFMRMLSGREN